MAWGLPQDVMNIVIRDQRVVRFEPDCIFGIADIAILNGTAVGELKTNAAVPGSWGAACSFAMLNCNVRCVLWVRWAVRILIGPNVVCLAIAHNYVGVIDPDGAMDIKPVNDLSIIA